MHPLMQRDRDRQEPCNDTELYMLLFNFVFGLNFNKPVKIFETSLIFLKPV